MYGKFFAQTFTGSMFGAGANVFAVWGYVIANARDGSVELNSSMMSAAIGMTVADVDKAIEYLCSSDERSRSRAEDGRRLVKEGAFLYRVVNHLVYRNTRDEKDRRTYMREYMRDYRASERKQPQQVNLLPAQEDKACKHAGKPLLAQAEAEAEAEAEERKEKEGAARPPSASRNHSKTDIAKALAICARAGLNGHRFDEAVPPFVLADTWKLYAQVRSKKRAPSSPEAYRGIVSDLAQYASDGYDPQKIIDRSAKSAWVGLFPKTEDALKGQRVSTHDDSRTGTLRAGEYT